MSLNWIFQRGGGAQTKKTLRGGEYGYFLEQHNYFKVRMLHLFRLSNFRDVTFCPKFFEFEGK